MMQVNSMHQSAVMPTWYRRCCEVAMRTPAMSRHAVVLLLLLVAGCQRYWVQQEQLDYYNKLNQWEDHTRFFVDGTRVKDGQAVRIRANALKPLPISDGTRRQVRLLRSSTVTGIVFASVGAAMAISGGAMFATSTACNPLCGQDDKGTFGVALIVIGIAHSLAGSALTAYGALTGEVGP
jgi:hypothetical protein